MGAFVMDKQQAPYRDHDLAAMIRDRRADLGMTRALIVKYAWDARRIPMTESMLTAIENGSRYPTIHQLDVLIESFYLDPERGVGAEMVARFQRSPRYAPMLGLNWQAAVAMTIQNPARTRLQHGSLDAVDPLVLIHQDLFFSPAEISWMSEGLLRRRLRGQSHLFSDAAHEILLDSIARAEADRYVMRPGSIEASVTKQIRLRVLRGHLGPLLRQLGDRSFRVWLRSVLLGHLATGPQVARVP